MPGVIYLPAAGYSAPGLVLTLTSLSPPIFHSSV